MASPGTHLGLVQTKMSEIVEFRDKKKKSLIFKVSRLLAGSV